MKKAKPYQILLRDYEITKMKRLIKYYEKEIGSRFTRADIIRIALNNLYNVKFKKIQIRKLK